MDQLDQVTGAILTEILGIAGLAHNRPAQGAVRSLFGLPARRLAGLLVQLDEDVARAGLTAGAENLLARLVKEYSAAGWQEIPEEGPLLVASNHPGAYDALLLIASLGRDDVNIITSDIGIFRHLPAVMPHFIQIGADPFRRMAAFRSAARHMQDGKAVLIFPRGEVEVDPALSPAARQGIERWSLSLDLFVRLVPQIRAVVATVSGVFSARWFNHPFLRIWKQPEQRQKVAEVLQVAEQLIFSKPARLTPHVRFSAPLTFEGEGQAGQGMERLTQTARDQLAGLAP